MFGQTMGMTVTIPTITITRQRATGIGIIIDLATIGRKPSFKASGADQRNTRYLDLAKCV